MTPTTPTPNLTILAPTPETIPSFARLTRTLLPINYGPKFFEATLDPPSAANAYSLARIAIWNDDPSNTQIQDQGLSHGQVVAGIYGRIQPQTSHDGTPSVTGGAGTGASVELYIATLAVLAPWRGQGIATALLRELVRAAVEVVGGQADAGSDSALQDGSLMVSGPLMSVCAHVWEVNDSALEWYTARGFEAGEVLSGYYRKLRPNGARLVRRGVVGLLVDGLEDEDGEGEGRRKEW